MPQTLEDLATIDDKLSKRHIGPISLFIWIGMLGYAKHFTNVINERGLAVDPETGKPIPVRGRWNGLTPRCLVGERRKKFV